ncbi:MAG: DoxX family protein [Taibaiella sp.]|jgi:uncharacterized membrane protein YphA (DoxX/SURF4 family)
MEKLIGFIHWGSYAYYVYIFGYASLFKVFQKQSMMDGMLSMGFDKTWTLAIGIAELLGILTVVAGLFQPRLKIIGILFLMPFAIGAFTAHMAHKEYHHFYNSLLVCIFTVVLLWTDKHFKMVISA